MLSKPAEFEMLVSFGLVWIEVDWLIDYFEVKSKIAFLSISETCLKNYMQI